MKTTMVQYAVKPEAATENAALIRRVYDELHATQPAGLRYATFVLEDGVSFVHLAMHEDETNPLMASPAFAAFRAGIDARVVAPPVARSASRIGAYGVGDD